MKNKKQLWRWITGNVDASEEHIEIRFGSARHSGWDEWIPIALVSAPDGYTFTVQFLIKAQKPHEMEMINEVKRQLDFYLIDKREEDPWTYAHHHCGTSANVYSMVHWSFYLKAENLDR